MDKNSQKRITQSDIADIRKEFAALLKASSEALAAKDIVRQLLPLIKEARELGRRYDEIAQFLQGRGVQISTSTLAAYVREATGKTEAAAGESGSNRKPPGSAADEAHMPDMIAARIVPDEDEHLPNPALAFRMPDMQAGESLDELERMLAVDEDE